MSASVLDQLTLGYRFLWNRRREAAAIELHVEPLPDASGVDARHLLSVLAELWPARAARMLLCVSHPALLLDLLVHGRPDGPWLALPPATLTDAVLRPRAQQAQARGLPLVWSGRTVEAMAITGRPGMYLSDNPHAGGTPSPGQIVQNSGRRAQADAALDQHAAWAVAGWPVEDVLDSLSSQTRCPARVVISRVVRAIDDDVSMERLETLLCADPLLAYRFLLHVNTTAPQLRGEIDTVQRGLQVWGLKHVQAWLLDQLPQAVDAPDLQPVRHGMVTRARLLEHLLDAGDEQELRREVHLCGLFSQLDGLLGEPLAAVLQRLPLSQRILQALLEHAGPYHPALQLAHALESTDTRATRLLAESYGYTPEDVNRALLRTLVNLAA
jgi:hypothetical protein